MAQFLGYRIKSTNIGKVEKILRLAKVRLNDAASAEYHRLLSEEVCELVDDVTLGVCQRPEYPLLEEATNRLNNRVSRAEFSSSGTEYDLRAGVTIIPDSQYTYLILNVSNPELEKAFCDTPGIEDYKVNDGDVQNNAMTAAAAKWDELRKRCEAQPSLLSAGLTNRMNVDPEKLTYDTPIVRAKVRARRSMTSRLLNQYACGKEIKSAELMPMMDKALEKLMDPDVQAEMDDMTAQLASTLIEITTDLVLHDPRQPAQHQDCDFSGRDEVKDTPPWDVDEDEDAANDDADIDISGNADNNSGNEGKVTVDAGN